MQRTIRPTSRAVSSVIQSATRIPLRQGSPFIRSRTFGTPLQRTATRWYSEATETKKEEVSAEGQAAAADGEAAAAQEQGQAASSEATSEDPKQKELEAARKEASEMKDRYMRSVADFRNLQERTKREVAAARSFAISSFAKDLIDSVDNLDRALTTVPKEALESDNKDLKSLYDGLKMTETILMNTLKKHGLERIDPTGEKFDPNLHEATFMTPQPDKEDNTVFYTQQKGFFLNGRVVRAPKVGVVKNS